MARGRGYAESRLATPAPVGVAPDRGAPMSDARPDTLPAKRVLLLQGPVGPFFRRLAKLLQAAGAEVHKVNFNGGDCLFYPTDAITWRGHPGDWPQFLARLLEQRRIDIVLLFGDCRPIHRVARAVAQQHGVKVGAFEEGYLRPNFITSSSLVSTAIRAFRAGRSFIATCPADPRQRSATWAVRSATRHCGRSSITLPLPLGGPGSLIIDITAAWRCRCCFAGCARHGARHSIASQSVPCSGCSRTLCTASSTSCLCRCRSIPRSASIPTFAPSHGSSAMWCARSPSARRPMPHW